MGEFYFMATVRGSYKVVWHKFPLVYWWPVYRGMDRYYIDDEGEIT